MITHPLLVDKFNSQKEQLVEQGNVFISTIDKERQTVSFRNPFDIPRSRLMHQVYIKVVLDICITHFRDKTFYNR